jgi:quinol monooxygenase YgiN
MHTHRREIDHMAVSVGLFVRLEAAPGRESDLADFLRGAEALVREETGTTVWYALQFGPSTFGIFDAFEDESGREAHLSGRVAQGLSDNAHLFAEPPSIEKVDVLAVK